MSDLNLNPRKIINVIKNYCKNKYNKLPTLSTERLESGKNQNRINIQVEDKSCIFIVYIKKNGKISIQIQGKDIELGEKVKEYVIKECQVSDDYQYNISIPYDKIFFDDFIVFLTNECGATEKIRKTTPTGVQYVYEAPFSDKITIHKYNNGNMFIQGKPLWLSQQINYFLADKECYSEIIKAQKETYKIDLNVSDLNIIFNNIFAPISSIVNSDIKKMLITSIAFTRLEISNLPDYSAFTSPALRSLESFIQEVFVKNNIPCIKKEDIGNYFSFELNKYVLTPCYVKGTINEKNRIYLENIYKQYHDYRHRLFHTDTPTNETFFVETKENSDKMIMEVCNLIKDGYTKLLQNKEKNHE